MRRPRVRITVLGIMAIVMIAALVLSWFRPLSQAEVERIAERHFLEEPGASRWVGRYKVRAWKAGEDRKGDTWLVDFTESGDGSHLAQMGVDAKGNKLGIGRAPGKFK